MRNYYESVSEHRIQDGFMIQEIEEPEPVPWYPKQNEDDADDDDDDPDDDQDDPNNDNNDDANNEDQHQNDGNQNEDENLSYHPDDYNSDGYCQAGTREQENHSMAPYAATQNGNLPNGHHAPAHPLVSLTVDMEASDDESFHSWLSSLLSASALSEYQRSVSSADIRRSFYQFSDLSNDDYSFSEDDNVNVDVDGVNVDGDSTRKCSESPNSVLGTQCFDDDVIDSEESEDSVATYVLSEESTQEVERDDWDDFLFESGREGYYSPSDSVSFGRRIGIPPKKRNGEFKCQAAKKTFPKAAVTPPSSSSEGSYRCNVRTAVLDTDVHSFFNIRQTLPRRPDATNPPRSQSTSSTSGRRMYIDSDDDSEDDSQSALSKRANKCQSDHPEPESSRVSKKACKKAQAGEHVPTGQPAMEAPGLNEQVVQDNTSSLLCLAVVEPNQPPQSVLSWNCRDMNNASTMHVIAFHGDSPSEGNELVLHSSFGMPSLLCRPIKEERMDLDYLCDRELVQESYDQDDENVINFGAQTKGDDDLMEISAQEYQESLTLRAP
ncbi:OLC1v1036192C1 [Oldenlandia corymbosa var. corymbosa]|uniref:OLC1v1036192C1 n=1 Tax=Oldenlandia corymbosa var. corymbosa TaxID=529605 RepID=A0AAV1CVE5_OLDCO|nr:OLC1v1036192C1 [Oldenlandia corymbosa var. corymbosa]